MFRRIPLVLLLLLGMAAAEDSPQGLTAEEAAERALAAHEAGDGAALRTLAEHDAPDPWIVAHDLCWRGAHGAALAFAQAAPRAAVRALPAYVESQRASPTDEAVRARFLALADALGASDWTKAAEIPGVADAPLTSVPAIRTACGRALALSRLGRRQEAARAFARAGDGARAVGWLSRAGAAYDSAGLHAYRARDWVAAGASWQACLDIARSLDAPRQIALTLNSLGLVHEAQDRPAEAIVVYRQALSILKEVGDADGASAALTNLGSACSETGAYTEAFAAYQAALRIDEPRGNREGAAKVWNNIGVLHRRLGEYPEALLAYVRSLALKEALGDEVGVTTTLNNMGVLYRRQGAYARALGAYRRALAGAQARGDGLAMARSLLNVGVVQGRMGQDAAALASYERALPLAEAADDKSLVGRIQHNLAGLHVRRGEYAQALAAYDAALAIARERRDGQAVCDACNDLGVLHLRAERPAEALAAFERSGAAARDLGDRVGMAVALLNTGNAQERLGRPDEALGVYEAALRVLAETNEPTTRIKLLWSQARVHLAQQRAAVALALARSALEAAVQMGEGLTEDEASGARELFSGLLAVGTQAALAAEDPGALLALLEWARAASLRESLGARDALRAAVVPRALHRALETASQAERVALRDYVRVASGRDLKSRRQARKALDEAHAAVREAVGHIRRDARAGAALAFPAPDDLATIQGFLQPGEALVYYGRGLVDAVALILEPARARIVSLGAVEAIDAARGASFASAGPADVALAGPRRLLAEPLRLGGGTRRVFVSPDGTLSGIPFALLFPSHEVAYVPSGTTYGLLRAQAGLRGQHVLGLGDPRYGAHRRLVPLPGTRAEVEAVADDRLLGEEATPAGLRAALSRRSRWRAVHLACHGVIDAEDPLRSALALSDAPAQDGDLTMLDVLRLRIPADLVVLSACDTARGTDYRVEGTVGLTRAFMFAGAPRVLCSLWKVDDEATRALMVRFYALWNPARVSDTSPKPPGGERGLNAAAALRQAQAWVRSHERWAHPRYWAAWVLWGPP